MAWLAADVFFKVCSAAAWKRHASNDCVQKMSVLKLVVFLGTLAQAAVPWRSWTQRRSEAFTPTPTGVEQAARIEAGFMWFYVDL